MFENMGIENMKPGQIIRHEYEEENKEPSYSVNLQIPKGYKVFVSVDDDRRVESIKSTCFDKIEENSIVIGEGFGDDFVYPINRYGSVKNNDGTHRYFLNENNEIIECSSDDIELELMEIKETELNSIDIEKLRSEKINESKVKLALWLADNPLLIDLRKDGTARMYTVTTEKQDELNKMIKLTESAEYLGIPFTPTWNETGKQCEPYTKVELLQLSLAMADYVYPQVERQRQYEVELMKVSSAKKLLDMNINYDDYVYEASKSGIPDTTSKEESEEVKPEDNEDINENEKTNDEETLETKEPDTENDENKSEESVENK